MKKLTRRTLISLAALLPVIRVNAAVSGRFDVIVVGAGIAGLAAAVSAAENGAKRVLVLEKGPMIGGHAIYADGTVSAVYPRLQKVFNIKDSPELMAKQIWEWGDRDGDLSLIRVMARESGPAIDWLRGMGVHFRDWVFVPYPSNFPRGLTSHPTRGGYEYIRALNRRARALPVEVRLNTRVVQLLRSGGAVTGVSASGPEGVERFYAPSVVLATGGFSANPDMIRRYSHIKNPGTHSSANPGGRHFDGATGDGIQLGTAVGAALAEMSYIEFIPFRGGRLLEYVGGDIFVNSKGERFVDEGGSHPKLTEALSHQPGGTMWVITDSQSVKGTTVTHKLMTGQVRKAANIDEMARIMDIDPEVLKKTISRYNSFVRKGRDDDFGKTIFTQEIKVPPYYFGVEYQDPHYTNGGIRINTKAEALNTAGLPIPGLFAAGETTGGIEGKEREGGMAFTDCLVFGRIAGREAARRVIKK